jgi:hypothetical protein
MNIYEHLGLSIPKMGIHGRNLGNVSTWLLNIFTLFEYKFFNLHQIQNFLLLDPY